MNPLPSLCDVPIQSCEALTFDLCCEMFQSVRGLRGKAGVSVPLLKVFSLVFGHISETEGRSAVAPSSLDSLGPELSNGVPHVGHRPREAVKTPDVNFEKAVSPERKVVERRDQGWRFQRARIMSGGSRSRVSTSFL